jgi:methyl-accepting chemotaxis protein
VTQKNAALVEEAANAAESMRLQADRLADVVGVFKVTGSGAGAGSGDKRLLLAA